MSKRRFRGPKKVKTQADTLTAQMKGGTHWSQIGGYRFDHDWKNHGLKIGFRLRQEYRLLCCIRDGILVWSKILSHEAYNAYAANTRR